MNKIEKYVQSCRLKDRCFIPTYSKLNACLIASFDGLASYKNYIYFEGKDPVSFEEAREMRKDFDRNY